MRLVREGSHTAVLPSIATAEFQLLKEKPLTFSLEGIAKRRLCLIWSARTLAMRAALERVQQAILTQLAF